METNMKFRLRKTSVLTLLIILCLGILVLSPFHTWTKSSTMQKCPCGSNQENEQIKVNKTSSSTQIVNRYSPYIFIGSVPRSGTTLMRVLLDAHPDIRCGKETHIIPIVLSVINIWTSHPINKERLTLAGISSELLDSALSLFFMEIMEKHGPSAKRICNKDPLVIKYMSHMHRIFPNAKFILMVRDGRAVVHSIISRNITVAEFNLTSYRQSLTTWNQQMKHMASSCKLLGPNFCLPVHYEQLVLHPRMWLERIFKFLQVPWYEGVMHHEKLLLTNEDMNLSILEMSTDQVMKPINVGALTKWAGKLPSDVVRDMPKIAPMLENLGYDPSANPPNYGKPDSDVVRNTNLIHRHQEFWNIKENNVRSMRRNLMQKAQTKIRNMKRIVNKVSRQQNKY